MTFTLFFLQAIGGESSRNIIDNIADILFTLNKFYTEQLAKWLHDLLNKEGYPSTRVNNQDKEQFIKSLLRWDFILKKNCFRYAVAKQNIWNFIKHFFFLIYKSSSNLSIIPFMVTELWPLIEKFVNLWFFSSLIFPWLSVLKVLSTMHMSSSILAIIMSYRIPLVISLFTLAGNRGMCPMNTFHFSYKPYIIGPS